MPFQEIKLIGVEEYFRKDWEAEYEFRALEINGRSRAAQILDIWREDEEKDYQKILKAAKLVGAGRPVTNQSYVKADEKRSGVYEMRAPGASARLLFYYAAAYLGSRKKGVVILLDSYWKTKSSKREQERSFQTARLMRITAEEHLDKLYQESFGSAPVRTKGK